MKSNVHDQVRTAGVRQGNDLWKSSAQKSKGRSRWLLPIALILLSIIPLFFGVLRLIQLMGGSEIMPANPRFLASPSPLVVHIVCAALFVVFGAFQFVTSFRQRHPGWHRVVGRLLVVCGLLVGLSGVWMTLFYPRADGTGDLLYFSRLLFGSAMVVTIVLSFTAIRRRDIQGHRAWMMRGYAIGVAAGTQALILMLAETIAGPPNELTHDLLMSAAWVINLAIAEWAIRRRRAPRARAAAAVAK